MSKNALGFPYLCISASSTWWTPSPLPRLGIPSPQKDCFLDPSSLSFWGECPLGPTIPSSYLWQSTSHTAFVFQLSPCSTLTSLSSETRMREKEVGGLGVRESALGHMPCSLEKLLNCSGTQLPHLWMGILMVYTLELFWVLENNICEVFDTGPSFNCTP